MADTLGSRLVHAAATGSGKGLVFVDRDERETALPWSDVYRRAAAVAGGLRERGVRPGDSVAVVLPTAPDFFDAFFGAVLAGAIPVPLYPPVRLGRLEEYHARTAGMLAAARVRLVLAGTRTWRILGEAVGRARPDLGCVAVDEVKGPAFAHEARAEDLAMVQFSSGTTVDPKPVALTHAGVLANVRAIRDVVLEAGAPVEHAVSWLPLYHDMGLIGSVFVALYHPASLTLIPPELFVVRPALWLRAISRTRTPVSAAPNFAYALCTERVSDGEMDGVDLGGWRFALNGSEPVAPATLRRFAQRFARWGFRPEALCPVYGLSEATLAVTFSDWRTSFAAARFDRDALAAGRVVASDDGVEFVSVGRPVAGVEVDAPVGEVGAIRVRGQSVMAGYLHQPDRTRQVIADGWLDTGDVGFFHEGLLYVSGRQKDVLILRGRNHAPHEVEHAVDAVAGVRTGCAAAVSHRGEDADEERLYLFVEARRDDPALADRCRDAVLEATGLDPGLVVVLAPGTLPRTSSGKIRRGEALRLWLSGSLTPPERVTPWLLAGELAKGTLAHWRRSLARPSR